MEAIMTKPEISVCIPAYEMNGYGALYLEASLERLAEQDFQNFEVIVSDQSLDDAVKSVCERRSDTMNISHLWNRGSKRQASTNINYALDHTHGRILKVLFQDDYLCDRRSLSIIHEKFVETGCDWLLCGSGIVEDGKNVKRPMIPLLTEKLHFGKNTVSSPSVLAIDRRCAERFDENLIWLMDVEFYKRLWDTKGLPAIVNTTLVANRIHDHQVSGKVDRKMQARELDYIWKKYASKSTVSAKLEFLKRRIKTIIAT
jgi:glycosyltransferase involved in cell wall biosynthesis